MQPPVNRPWQTEEASARRFHDALQLHYTVLSWEEIAAGRVMAIQLGDGSSDNTAYESHTAAVASVRIADPNRYLYFTIPPDRPPVEACDAILMYARRLYDNGYRPAGAHEGAQLIMPTRREALGDNPMLAPADQNHRGRWS